MDITRQRTSTGRTVNVAMGGVLPNVVTRFRAHYPSLPDDDVLCAKEVHKMLQNEKGPKRVTEEHPALVSYLKKVWAK